MGKVSSISSFFNYISSAIVFKQKIICISDNICLSVKYHFLLIQFSSLLFYFILLNFLNSVLVTAYRCSLLFYYFYVTFLSMKFESYCYKVIFLNLLWLLHHFLFKPLNLFFELLLQRGDIFFNVIDFMDFFPQFTCLDDIVLRACIFHLPIVLAFPSFFKVSYYCGQKRAIY